jgi:hypothetical protein
MRMFERSISFDDIDQALSSIRVIEEYPDDQPYPSCLILGFTFSNEPIHIVYSVNEEAKLVYVITVYAPDASKWADGFSKRRR